MADTAEEILKGLTEGEQLLPIIIGLIALLRQTGDARPAAEILGEARTAGTDTKTITEGDM